jgi:hypothetical protein
LLDGTGEAHDSEVSVTILVDKESSVGSGTYYVGTVQFEGNKAISDAELIKELGLQKGAYFDFKVFVAHARRFNSTGRSKPIVENDFEVELGEEGRHDDTMSSELNFKIRIVETRNHPDLSGEPKL